MFVRWFVYGDLEFPSVNSSAADPSRGYHILRSSARPYAVPADARRRARTGKRCSCVGEQNIAIGVE
jgi:hypothetical protein